MTFRVLIGVGGLLVSAGCVSEPKVKPTEDSRATASQPAISGAARMTETEACEALLGAVTDREADLNCEERDVALACPDLLRASNPPCAEYAANTVNECVAEINGYEECEDFSLNRCIATSIGGGCPTEADGSVAPDGGAGAPDGG